MKATFLMKNLQCANCALKMEKAIGKIPGVNSVSISFIYQKMIIDMDENNAEDIIAKAQAHCSRIERGCEIVTG